jgi:hypothetical protein
LLSLALGLWSFFNIYKSWPCRAVAAIALFLLAFLALNKGGVYSTFTTSAIGIIPLFLFFLKRNKIDSKFIVFLLLAGVTIGFSHYLRSYSGAGILVFSTIVILGYLRVGWRQKTVLYLTLITGIMISILFFNSLIDQRDDFFKNSNKKQYLSSHLIWHSVYIGFGFLNNPFNIKFDDKVAHDKAKSISPDITISSKPHEYNQILKNETLKLVKGNKIFTLFTLFAKLGIVFLYFLIFANLGLAAAILRPKDKILESSFWLGILLNSGFGLLVIPSTQFLMGLIAFATLYGIVSINEFFERDLWLQT